MLTKKDFISLCFIFLIIVLFMIPAYAGWTALFNDDCMQQSFPRLVAVARNIQNLEIPLWDNNTFSGAKAFYNVFETPVYNIFLYPFYFIADTNDLTQCFFVLYLIPFTIYMLLAAFACYFLGTRAIRLDPFASIAIGIIYALSPVFSISFDSLLNSSAHAFMPLIILGFAKFIERNNLKWWILTIISVILLNLTFQLNYTIRIHFIVAIIIFLLIILKEGSAKDKILILLKSGSIFAFSTLICTFIWFGVLDGIHLLKQMNISAEDLNDQNSMHPLTLITLIIPNFFGVNSGINSLGIGVESVFSSSTLSGGLFAFLSFCICITALLKKNQLGTEDTDHVKWAWTGIILFVISIISMLGKYTPIYGITGLALPFIYKLPHPIYFNNLQGFSAALCAGIGFSLLLKNEKMKKLFFSPKAVAAVISSIVILVLFTTYLTSVLKNENFNPLNTLSILISHNWFLTAPGLYFIFSIICLALLFLLRNNVFFKYMFFMLLLAEGIYVGQQVLYERNELKLPGENNAYRESILGNYRFPNDSPMYQKIEEIKKLSEELNCRFTGSVSELDNLAWITGGKSLLGYDAKPIIPGIVAALEKFMKYDLYEMWTIKYPRRFLQNMNVGLFIAHDGIVSNPGVFLNPENDQFFYLQDDEAIRKKIENEESGYEDIFISPELRIYKIPDFMPYIYTNDKLFFTVENEQINKLLFEDLRHGVHLDEKYFNLIKKYNSNSKKSGVDNFRELQSLNKIFYEKNKYSNKLSIRADIKKSSMMVISEIYHPGWKAFIDNKETRLFKVNYLQQGIWLEQGIHKITLKFKPKNMVYAVLISVFSSILLLMTCIILYKKILLKK